MSSRSKERLFRTRSFRSAVEAMKKRTHFSANSVKAIDSGGPDFSYVESSGGEDSFFGDAGDDLLLSADGSLNILYGGAGTDTATRDSNEKAIGLIEV